MLDVLRMLDRMQVEKCQMVHSALDQLVFHYGKLLPKYRLRASLCRPCVRMLLRILEPLAL